MQHIYDYHLHFLEKNTSLPQSPLMAPSMQKSRIVAFIKPFSNNRHCWRICYSSITRGKFKIIPCDGINRYLNINHDARWKLRFPYCLLTSHKSVVVGFIYYEAYSAWPLLKPYYYFAQRCEYVILKNMALQT